jgi:hypothetical protein
MSGRPISVVMAGLDPAIHVFGSATGSKAWMPATSSAKTRFALLRVTED